MTPNPYRDLFVAIPDALLTVLRGVIEGSLKPTFLAPRPLIIALNSTTIVRQLCDLHGWLHLEFVRAARHRAIEVVAVPRCRHPVSRFISDSVLEDSARPEHELSRVLHDLARTRECTCMEVTADDPVWCMLCSMRGPSRWALGGAAWICRACAVGR